MFADILIENCVDVDILLQLLPCRFVQPSAVLSTRSCHYELSSYCNTLLKFVLPSIAATFRTYSSKNQFITWFKKEEILWHIFFFSFLCTSSLQLLYYGINPPLAITCLLFL
jgi:hypothetical protein